MTSWPRLELASALAVLLLSIPAATLAARADSFRLVAHAPDLEQYYPTYLANGHWSIASSPLGTDAAAVQIAGLMDNTPGDVSRPAGVPSFGEIDYFDGSAWLNAGSVQTVSHRGYRQTLDMQHGTLTTEYVWHTASQASQIRADSFVSQSDPHLAVVHLEIVPRKAGPIRLRFTLRSPPPPERLPLARMSAAEFTALATTREQQDAARGGRRDVIWYPGEVKVSAQGVNKRQAVLWLAGLAPAGRRVELALAVDIPRNLPDAALAPINEPGTVGLELRATAVAGMRYRFTKFAVAATEGWTLAGDDPAGVARATRARGYADALERHQSAWARLWRNDIEVEGSPQLQRTLHSDLFYLLENSASDQSLPAGACGFSSHYFGHVFWDNDLWVFPALLLLHPDRARKLIDYRRDHLPEAQARAAAHGFGGAMFPWEADPASGLDVTPRFAIENADREVHVNSAVALAQWQYFLASGDVPWLRKSAYPVIAAVADFWVSRVARNVAQARDEIRDVTSPEEDYVHVDNEIYTNVSARQSLLAALAAGRTLGVRPQSEAWRDVAQHLYQPVRAVDGRFLEFDANVPHDKTTSWMASSVPMLAIPALNLDFDGVDVQGLFSHAAQAVQSVRDHANQMILVMMAMLAADAGKVSYYSDLLGADGHAADPFLKPPFNVRSETPQNDSTYLLASSGGFIQAFIYGLTGLRFGDSGLEARFAPTLPSGVDRLTVRGVQVRGRRGELTLVREPGGVRRSIAWSRGGRLAALHVESVAMGGGP